MCVLCNTLCCLSCRRSGVTASDAKAGSRPSQLSLSPKLTTYLLCIVGFVLEDGASDKAQQIAVAAKAVAVYKLLRQVRYMQWLVCFCWLLLLLLPTKKSIVGQHCKTWDQQI